ncbi:MAG: hypothetical protein V7707_01080 [Motiliproteus sp.]
MLAIAWLLTVVISDSPWVEAPPAISAQQAQQVKALAKRTLRSVNQDPVLEPEPKSISSNPDRQRPVEVSHSELDALAAMLARAYPQLHSKFDLTPGGVILTSSLRLPDNPFGRYLSLRLRLPISIQELRIDRLQLGQLEIPEPLLQRLIPGVTQLLFGAEQSHILLHTARLSAITTDRLTLLIDPPNNASQQLVQILGQVRSFSGESPSLNRLWISQYYSLLQQQAMQLESGQWVSMTYFIAPLLRRIGQQAEPEQTHLHSQAAIMALALYLGSGRFEQIIGPVLSDDQRRQRPHYRTLLRGRVDLRQHFIVSAALQVLADVGFSQAIGEFKELLDSGQGGSGFSFADLAADRAGTLFAQHISRNPHQATILIDRLDRPLREPDLMIPIDQLPEGLTQTQFQQHYRDLDSENYQLIIDRIDTDLNNLRLYSER